MIGISKKFRIGKGIAALSCLLLIAAASLLSYGISRADSVTYKWIDTNTIEVTGPGIAAGQKINIGNSSLTGGKNANGLIMTTGGCAINTNFNVSNNNTIQVTSNNIPISTSGGGPKICDQATADKYFKVGSTGTVSGTPAQAQETPQQKTTCISVGSDLDPNKNPPANMQVKITGPNGERTITINKTNLPTDGSINYDGCVELEPGKYTICPLDSIHQCKTIEKVKYEQPATVIFPSEGAGSRKINVTVNANNLICDPNTGQVLQSFTLQLKDKDGNLLDTISTDEIKSAKWSQTISSEAACNATFSAHGDFTNVNPGNYTVCLVGFDKCQSIQKVYDQNSQVVFDISGQDAQNMLKNQSEVDANKGVTCAVEKLGWMICPLLTTISKVSDEAFKLLADNLLKVDTELINSDDASKGTFKAWSTFRDIANVAFVAAFLFLIYSQITGMGTNNYGIKRMLPRLIVAAILVNTSYYICQLAVDVTNILGYSLKEWFDGIAQDLYKQSKNAYADVFAKGNLPLTIIAATALGAAMVWVLLPILFSVLVTVLVAILTIVIILLLRKAFIVLLIVMAPLAFVAYLLPNTEVYFNKWRKMFIELLMVFPIVSLLFGAGQLASAVIMTTGTDFTAPAAESSMDSAKTSGGEELTGKQQVDLSMGLVATGLAITPLLATYAVLKGAISSTGAIGGWVEARRKQGMKAGSAYGKNLDSNSAYNRGKQIRAGLKKNYQQKKMLRRLGEKGPMGTYTRVAMGGIPGVMPSRLRTPIMKAQAGRVNRMAIVAAKKIEEEDINDAKANINRSNPDLVQLSKLLQDALADGMSDTAQTTAKAAASMLLGRGASGIDMLAAAIMAAESNVGANSEQVKALRAFIVEKHPGVDNKSSAIFSWAADEKVATGNAASLAAHIGDAGSYNYLSDSEISTQTPGSIRGMIAAGVVDKAAAQRILKSTSADNLGKEQRQELERIA